MRVRVIVRRTDASRAELLGLAVATSPVRL